MPWFGSNQDRLIATTIERWQETAACEVEDIRGWRGHTDDRAFYAGDPSRGWREMPNHMMGDTYYLCSWIGLHHPTIDTAPLQDIYDAIHAWHDDHSDERIVEQHILDSWLRRAMAALGTVLMGVDSRVVHQKPADASPEQEVVECTPPMAKEEAARRYLDDDGARWRKAKPLLKDRVIECEGTKKIKIRLDGLPQAEKSRLLTPRTAKT